MANSDPDNTNRDRTTTERESVVVDRSGGTGWWIGGLLVLAVLIIGFIALTGGEPAPVEETGAPAVEEPAPAEPAPAEGGDTEINIESAPATTEPEAEPAPAEPEAAPAEPEATTPAE